MDIIIKIFIWCKIISYCNGDEYDDSAINNCINKLSVINNEQSVFYVLQDDSTFHLDNQVNITITIFNVQNLFILKDANEIDIYVIPSTSLSIILETLADNYYVNNLANFVIIDAYDDELQEIFDILWIYRMVNSVVITKDLKIYTYYPISGGNCNEVAPIFVSNCSSYNSSVKLFQEGNLYYFSGCTLVCFAIPTEPYVNPGPIENNTGIAVRIIEEVAKILKLEPVFKEHPYNSTAIVLNNGTIHNMYDKVENGSYLGIYQDLYEWNADIIIGAIPQRGAKDFVTLYPFSYIHQGFFVPVSKLIPPWKNILLIFAPYTWAMMIIVFLIFNLTWYYFAKEESKMSPSGSVLFILATFITVPSWRPVSMMRRIVWMFWVIHTFIIISSFTTVLISYMFKPNHEREINSIEQLYNYNLKIIGFKSSTDTLLEYEDTYVKALHSRANPVLVLNEECWSRFVYVRDISIFTSTLIAGYGLKKFGPGHAKLLQPRFSLQITMVVRRGSIYHNQLSRIIMLLHESGLLQFWTPKDVDVVLRRYRDANCFVPVSLEHVLLVMYLYIGGIVLSFLVFIWECFYLNYVRR